MEFSLSQKTIQATTESYGSGLMSSKKKAGAAERHLPPGLPPDLRGGGNLFVPEPGARFSQHSSAPSSAIPHPQSANQIPHTVSRAALHQSHPRDFESGPDFDATASDGRYRSNFPSNTPEVHVPTLNPSNPRLARKREKSAERVDRAIRKEEKKKLERRAAKKAKALKKGLKILKESRSKRKRRKSSSSDSTSSSSDSDSSSDSSLSKSRSKSKKRKSKSKDADSLSLANMSLSESASSHGRTRVKAFNPLPPNPSTPEPMPQYRIPRQAAPSQSDTGTVPRLYFLSNLICFKSHVFLPYCISRSSLHFFR